MKELEMFSAVGHNASARRFDPRISETPRLQFSWEEHIRQNKQQHKLKKSNTHNKTNWGTKKKRGVREREISLMRRE